jgi:hypothetical protein
MEVFMAVDSDSPKKVTVDGDSAEQHPLTEQIDAEKWERKKAAAARTGLPWKLGKIRPPSSV